MRVQNEMKILECVSNLDCSVVLATKRLVDLTSVWVIYLLPGADIKNDFQSLFISSKWNVGL